jgi:hypothetical protein
MLISENTGSVGENLQNSADVVVTVAVAIAKDSNDG